MNLIKNFHSLPSFYLLILFSSGIAISWHFGTSFNVSYLVVLFSLICIFLFFQRSKQSSFFYFFCLNFVLAGVIYSWFSIISLSEKEFNLFSNDISDFQGTIVQVNKRASKKDIYLMKCEKVIISGKSIAANGFIVINQGKYKGDIHYGDLIRIKGRPQLPALPSNPGGFNYRKYLQLNKKFFYFQLKEGTQIVKIFANKGNWIQSIFFNPIRESLRSAIDAHLNGQSAAIVKALILGEKGNLDSEIISDFQKTGVIHVLAISGLHVGFIALLLQLFLSLLRIPKKVVMALIILFLVLFLALVNFKAPVVRASLMMTFYYLSKLTMRPQDPVNVVSLAAISILLVSPEQLFLPGFQYSFLAVFGLIYGNKKFKKIIPVLRGNNNLKKLINGYIVNPFISSLSAILATVPLTWYYFGSFQIGALIANIFVIPVIGLIVFLSIILLLFSVLNFLPAAGVAIIVNALIVGLIKVISAFSEFPFVQIITGPPPFILIIFVSIGIYLLFNISNSKSKLAFLYLALFVGFLIFSRFQDQNKLRVTFIDVGQGDASLIQFPTGKTALIDAGNKGFGFDAGKRYVDPVLKYYGISEITYLIGSHPHSDHIGGFGYIMNNYLVDTLIFNEVDVSTNLYKNLLDIADKNKIIIKRLNAGDMLNADESVRMYVLHPPDQFENITNQYGASINNTSLVIKLVHGNTSILFSGDAEVESEHILLRYGDFLDCDLLKVGHHGSKTSSSSEYLKYITPDYAVISVGRNNKFKHPSISTLTRFAQFCIPALRTDLNGAIIFESDGKKLNRIHWR